MAVRMLDVKYKPNMSGEGEIVTICISDGRHFAGKPVLGRPASMGNRATLSVTSRNGSR